MKRRCTLLLWLSAAALGPASAQGMPPSGCGSLANHYGPFDYRVEKGKKLNVVDTYHFTPPVEALIKGESTYLGGDLSYVLRTSPNHHRALMSLVRWVEKTKSSQPPEMQYSIDCYFERALRFQPDDTVVRTLYAHYLGDIGRAGDARSELARAAAYAKDNAVSHYNIGLVYFEIKDYNAALAQAHEAANLGYDRPDLPNLLKKVDAWHDRPAEAPMAASAPASTPAAASSPAP